MYWKLKFDGIPKIMDHISVRIGSKVYSFGGSILKQNTIKGYLLDTKTQKWTKIPSTKVNGIKLDYPDVPSNRIGHSIVAYGDKIYLWGGKTDEYYCSILFCFDTKTMKWSQVDVTGCIPYARDGHSACVFDNKMFIYGGFEDRTNMYAKEVYCVDLISFDWEIIHTLGNPPLYRDFHSATVVGNNMYVFGGRGNLKSPKFDGEEIDLCDVKYLNLITHKWYTPKVVGDVPEGRQHHSAFAYYNEIYIFGGYTGTYDMHLNDVWRFSPKQNCWSSIETIGKSPEPRSRQGSALIGTELYIFGGTGYELSMSFSTDKKTVNYSDTHILEIAEEL